MTVVEIPFVVDEGPNDGKPNGWTYLGLRFTPTQWGNYIADITDTPGTWGPRVNAQQKRAYKRLRGQIIAGLEVITNGTKTAEQMREEAYGPAGGYTAEQLVGQLIDNNDRMVKALATHTQILAVGEDTNAGDVDLMNFGVLLADLTPNEIDQMFMTKYKATHPLVLQETENPKSERILYEPPVFQMARVNRWRDSTDYVAVDRGQTPFLYSDTSWHELT